MAEGDTGQVMGDGDSWGDYTPPESVVSDIQRSPESVTPTDYSSPSFQEVGWAELTPSQWQDVQQQQADIKQEQIKVRTLQGQIQAREKAISGLSYEAKKRFISQASPQEQVLLRRGTDISTLDIGSKGTIRTKYKPTPEPYTELERAPEKIPEQEKGYFQRGVEKAVEVSEKAKIKAQKYYGSVKEFGVLGESIRLTEDVLRMPYKMVQEITKQYITPYRKEVKEYYEEKGGALEFLGRASDTIILGTVEFAGQHPLLASAVPVAIEKFPTIAKTVFGASGGLQIIGGAKTLKGALRLPKGARAGEFGQATGEAVLGTLMLAPILKDMHTSIFTRDKPIQVIPSKSLQEVVKPFSRQRVTLMLKTKKGKYIFGKTKSGQLISIGGGIEKGQTPRQALKMELKQETGLTLKDITDLKFVREFVTPEETFYTYVGTLKKGAKIKPASDILSIAKISPRRARTLFGFGKQVTGMTAKYPVSKGGIRAYELGIMSYLETGKEPTWLKLQTKQGEFFLGTQSRYNVDWNIQRKYLDQQTLLLAHGTPSGTLVRRYSPFKKGFKIKPGQRGGDQGLYFQPPAYVKKFKVKGYEKISIKDYKILPEYYNVATDTLLGKYIKVKGYKRTAQKGYIGLSYLGIEGAPAESLGIRFGINKPTAYILKAKPVAPIVSTKKARAGVESELIAQVGTYLQSFGRAEKFKIAGKKVYTQELKIVKGKQASLISRLLADLKRDMTVSQKRKVVKALKKETGIEYGQYTYVDPTKLIPLKIPYKKGIKVKTPIDKIMLKQKMLEVELRKSMSISVSITKPYKPSKSKSKAKSPMQEFNKIVAEISKSVVKKESLKRSIAQQVSVGKSLMKEKRNYQEVMRDIEKSLYPGYKPVGYKESRLLKPSLRYPPSYPPSKPPTIPPPPIIPIIDIERNILRQQQLPRKRKQVRDLFYIPDFTSKVLGIDMKATAKQQQKLLRQVFTGMELRPGVRF